MNIVEELIVVHERVSTACHCMKKKDARYWSLRKAIGSLTMVIRSLNKKEKDKHMDTVKLGLKELIGTPHIHLEELLAKNIRERNAIVIALRDLGTRTSFVETETIDEEDRVGFKLEVGYVLSVHPTLMYKKEEIDRYIEEVEACGDQS